MRLLVGARGFEPPTSASRTRRANQAALRPDTDIIGGFNLLGNSVLRGSLREARLSFKTRSPEED